MISQKFGGLTFEYPESASPNWSNENIIDGVFRQNTYQIEPRGVVVDIGANIGSFTLLAAKTASFVRAFEPSRSNFEYLMRNVDANRPLFRAKVESFNLGVGKPGPRDLNLNPINCGAFSMFDHGSARDHDVEMIECISLHTALADLDHVDLLKSDSEGAEWEFLFEAPRELFEKIDQIVMEVHLYKPEWREKQMTDLLEGLGYRIRKAPANVPTCFTLFATKV